MPGDEEDSPVHEARVLLALIDSLAEYADNHGGSITSGELVELGLLTASKLMGGDLGDDPR